jgi:hypothetical protein
MDRIYYAGDSVLTGSAIAKALLEYAEALAKEDTSTTVEVPTRLPDGTIGRSRFLIGPASQLVSDYEPSGYEEILDEGLVADFVRETRKLTRPSRPVTDDEPLADAEWQEDWSDTAL